MYSFLFERGRCTPPPHGWGASLRYLAWDGGYLPKSGVGVSSQLAPRQHSRRDETLAPLPLWKRVGNFRARALGWNQWTVEARFM
jgi:hypothetical protein